MEYLGSTKQMLNLIFRYCVCQQLWFSFEFATLVIIDVAYTILSGAYTSLRKVIIIIIWAI